MKHDDNRDVTKQKRAVEQLNFQFKNSPDIILVIDRDFKIEVINRIATGDFTVETLKGRDAVATLPPEDQAAVRQKLSRCFETGEIQEFEHGIGDGKWVRARVVPMPEGQTIPRVMIISTDITERRQAEAACRENEERLSALSANLADGMVYQIDSGPDGVQRRFSYLSPAVERFHGLTVAAVTRDPELLYNQVMAEDRAKVAAAEARAFADKVKLEIDVRVRVPSGEVRWRRFISSPRIGQDGIWLWDGIEVDITERKQAEEALRESERNYRTLFREMLNGFARNEIVCDAQGRPIDSRYLAINPAFERLSGKKAEEVVGRRITEVFPTMDPEWIEIFGRVALTGKPEHFEKKVATLDAWFEVMAFCPAPNQYAFTCYNITERKQAEEERERLQAQLIQAQKMESVGRLAGGVAHDFNNMLGVILGYAEMALDQVEPTQPLHAELVEIHRAAQRSADLTRQLLAFARKQTVMPKVLDLNETVEGMLKMLRRLIGEDIDLAWLPGHNLGALKIDPSQIDQILANLCVNARDAVGRGEGGRVTIETGVAVFNKTFCQSHPGFLPGEFLLLAVSDNGCGMDAETRSHLFEPFFTTKETGKGTGLGLATVYGIVGQNDGFVDVESEPGRGSTFKVYLPRSYKTTPPPEAGVEKPSPQGCETILLVEDEPALMTMTMRMLTRQGYTVLTAATPTEAIRLARENAGAIHLLMTDVVMPEMNGRDLANMLLSRYPDLKRLFMSGYSADVIAHHGVLEEGVHFLQKPFTRSDLLAKVRQALAQDQ